MATGAVLVMLAVGVSAVVVLELLTRDLRFRWRLGRLPCTRIAEARSGRLVKIVGTVGPASGSVRCLAGAPCVYHHALHEELVTTYIGGARVDKWLVVGEEDAADDFVVTDDSGSALVCGAGAAVAVVLPEAAYETVVDGDNGARARTGAIRPGQRVAIVGTASWEAPSSPELVDRDRTRERLYRDEPRVLVVRDAPGAPLILDVVE
jgi:hypothetical protein